MGTSDREVRATSYGVEPQAFVGTFREFGRRERLSRAAGRFLPLLGGALVSVPIPGWHFVGLPGFLIAAFVFGGRALREHSRLERLCGRCPSCDVDQDYPAPAALVPGTRLACPACGEFIALSVQCG